jgi:hypothetical protein
MIRRNYLPNNERDKIAWLEQLGIKLPVYATLLGITATEIASVNNDILMCKALLAQINAIINELKKRVKYKNTLLYGELSDILGAFPSMVAFTAPTVTSTAGALERADKLIDRLRKHANYTPAIGKDLGIEPVGSPMAAASTSLAPEFTISISAGCPVLRFSKLQRRVVNIYVDRGDNEGFTLLNSCSFSTFTDTFPLAQNVNTAYWKYKAIYLNKEGQYGEFSVERGLVVKREVSK